MGSLCAFCLFLCSQPWEPIRIAVGQLLRTISWGQSPKKSLNQEIQDAVPDGHNPLEKGELDKIATETLRFVLLGQAAFDDDSAVERDKYVQFLNVYLAIDAAWKKAFPAWQI